MVLELRDGHKMNDTTQVADLRQEFMEWLIDPGRIGTQVDFAKTHGVSAQTLTNWKRDPSFRAELDRRLGQMNVDSLRIQKVVDAMWDKASQGDVKAAELYLRYIEKIQPNRPVLDDDVDVKKLSDEELLEALQSASEILKGK